MFTLHRSITGEGSTFIIQLFYCSRCRSRKQTFSCTDAVIEEVAGIASLTPCLAKTVRFIAVTDDFDSNKDDGANGLMISLKNMINEAYSMDIGKKIKAQQEQAIKEGQFVGAKPPYGYDDVIIGLN